MTTADPPTLTPQQSADLLRGRVTFSAAKERLIRGALFMCAFTSVLITVAIIFTLVTEAVVGLGTRTAFFQDVSVWEFFTETRWTPQYAEKHFGLLPLLCGTFLVAGIAGAIGLPIGVACAVYLSEYARPSTRNRIKPMLEILAGIPTIVYGYFAWVFVTPYLIRPIFQDLLGFNVSIYNALSAGIVVAIMIIPLVSSLSEDALRSVPRGLREAGYALGSTKFDVSVKVVVPAAISGILASFLLAVSRAIGETMAVAIAAGQTPQVTLNPLLSVQTMTSYIVNVSQGDTPVGTPSYKSLYAVALTLFCITLMMNLLSHFVIRRYREVYE